MSQIVPSSESPWRQSAQHMTGPQRLRLLAIDGGGVKGLAALICLLQVMMSLRFALTGKHTGPLPKPCDHFDMMVGTSTGGLIAIMLGRLNMGIEECITEYLNIMDPLFPSTWLQWAKNKAVVAVNLDVKSKYDHRILETHIKRLVKTHTGDENTLLRDERLDKLESKDKSQEHVCKVAVMTMDKNTSGAVALTSYFRPNVDTLFGVAKIWEAARATSAATGYFEPIVIGPFKRPFYDAAAIGSNNPVNHLWNLAKSHFLDEPHDNFAPNVQCLLSLGTGLSSLQTWDNKVWRVPKHLVNIITDTRQTAEAFATTHSELRGSGVYLRLDAEGVGDTDLAAAEDKALINSRTEKYLSENDYPAKLKAFARRLIVENPFHKRAPTWLHNIPVSHKQHAYVFDDCRNENITALRNVLDEGTKQQGEGISVATLHGSRGTGKSRLIYEFCLAITTRDPEATEDPQPPHQTEDDSDLFHDGLSRTHRGFTGLRRDVHVFWVSAMTKEKFVNSYRSIHRCIFSGNKLESDPHVFMREVQMWLEDPKNGPWLLILDDAHLHVFRQDEGMCSRYIPGTSSNAAGCIFITSVSNFFDTMFNLHLRESLTIQGLEKDAARGLFLSILNPTSGNDAAIDKVVSTLDMLPSAIISAASYCKVALVSPRNYQHRWEKCPRLRLDGLNFIYGSDFEKQASHSLITAWQMTFEMIRERSSEANQAIALLRTLLCLCAEDLHSGLFGEEFTGEHYGTLVEYGVLRRCQRLPRGRVGRCDVDHFTMLRHVQIIGQTWLWANDRDVYTQAHMRVLDILAQRAQECDAPNRRKRPYETTMLKQRALLPHLEFFLKYCQQTASGTLGPATKPITSEQTEVITYLANLYSVEGLFTEAKHLLEFAYRTHREEDHSRVRCLLALAATLRNSDQAFSEKHVKNLKKATDMLNEAREICRPFEQSGTTESGSCVELKIRFGVEIEEGMAMTMCERGTQSAYSSDPQLHARASKFFENAMFHQKRALYLNYKLFGEDSTEFLQSRLQRARIRYNMGKLLVNDSGDSNHHNRDENTNDRDDAEKTQKTRRLEMLRTAAKEQDEVVESWQLGHREINSDDTRRLYAAQAALARTLYALGKSSEAEKWLKKAYDGRKRLLGKDAAKTLTTGQDLAMCMLSRHVEEAEHFWQRIYAYMKNRHGPDHPIVQSAKHKWDEKLETLRCKTPVINETNAACDHSDTASVSTLRLS